MTVTDVAVRYFVQLKRSPDGLLWVVLFRDNAVIKREQVRSRRQGRRRLIDLVVLTEAEPIRAGLDRKETAAEMESTPRARESREHGAKHRDAGTLRCGSTVTARRAR